MSWGWVYISTHIQTGGRQATMISVVGSQPQRPRPAARSSHTNPSKRNTQVR